MSRTRTTGHQARTTEDAPPADNASDPTTDPDQDPDRDQDAIDGYVELVAKALDADNHRVERYGPRILVSWDGVVWGQNPCGAKKASRIQDILDSDAPLKLEDTHDGDQLLEFYVPEEARTDE